MYPNRNYELTILNLYAGSYLKEFYLREISRTTKIPLKTVQRVTGSLEARKILKGNIHGKNKYFMLNLSNIQSKLSMLQSEIYKTQLFLNKYPQCKAFVKELTHATIIVFGSFAKFTAQTDSDIDLLIISNEAVPLHLLPHKIHAMRLSEKSFMKALAKQETLIKEIEENHVILNNHSFYIDMTWSHYAR